VLPDEGLRDEPIRLRRALATFHRGEKATEKMVVERPGVGLARKVP